MGLLSRLFSRKGTQLTRTERKVLRRGKELMIRGLAQNLVKQGAPERALILLREAMARFPESEAISQMLESVDNTVTWKMINSSLPLCENDSNPELRARLSELYFRIGDNEQAFHYGREAIQIDPENHSGYRALGRLFGDF